MKHYPLLTLHEVAEALNVAPRTIYAWGKQGKIPAFKLGTKWMFDLKEIDAWVERQRLND
jgi:excisionase family DNA binding protein